MDKPRFENMRVAKLAHANPIPPNSIYIRASLSSFPLESGERKLTPEQEAWLGVELDEFFKLMRMKMELTVKRGRNPW
jgi:hypothetical protein